MGRVRARHGPAAHQPYQDYLLKFGPFWIKVYESLGLYDVYSVPRR